MTAASESFPSQLGLTFREEPPGLIGEFVPKPEHRGPPGFLHGGLAATCLDETMAVLGYVLDGVHTVTGTLNLRYKLPVPLDAGVVRCEAWRDGEGSRRARRVHGRLVLADGRVAVEAVGLFVQVR